MHFPMGKSPAAGFRSPGMVGYRPIYKDTAITPMQLGWLRNTGISNWRHTSTPPVRPMPSGGPHPEKD